MDSAGTVIFLVVIALVIAAAIASAIAARKRREALFVLAAELGLDFKVDRDRHLADRFAFLNKLAQGTNRYACNILSGLYGGHEIFAFDYHYETHTTDSKGRRHTHHHHFSCFILLLPKNFPELTIASEGILSKLAQAFGYEDIDFESHEFSRKFCVRSKEKKFAYDVCHARMIEYLLAHPDLNIEIEGPALTLAFPRRLAAEGIRLNLERLLQVRSLFPNYLLA